MRVIIGIDPGITTGLCALDLNGNLVDVFSSKKMGIRKIIEWINKIGKPVIIACDVKVPPYLVKEICRKFKAKIVCPKKDMKIGEKQKLVEKYIDKIKDSHQRDACAASLFAYKKFEPLFKKIKKNLEKIGKLEKLDDVKKKIILGEAKSIKEALKEKQERKIMQVKKRVKKIEKESEVTRLKKDVKLLKNFIENLKERCKILEKKNLMLRNELLKRKTNEKLLEIAKKRKETIVFLEKKINDLKNENKILTKKLNLIKKHKCYFVSKLKNLSKDEIFSLNDKNFKDIIFVEEVTLPGKISIKNLKELSIEIIIYNKGEKEVISFLEENGFELINSNDIKIFEEGGIYFVKEEEIERFRKSISAIEKILKEYSFK